MKTPHLAACTMLSAAVLMGCAAPKQVAPPPILDSGEEDIAPEEEKELEPAAKMPDEMSTSEKKAACCAQCAKGLAADRTGQPADQIPCADFTSVLEEWCLSYFRDSPMQASECQSAAPQGEPSPSTDEAGASSEAPAPSGDTPSGS